jgi:hypothetical protein
VHGVDDLSLIEASCTASHLPIKLTPQALALISCSSNIQENFKSMCRRSVAYNLVRGCQSALVSMDYN